MAILIDAEELMMAMLRIATIDGKIPLDTVIDILWEAQTAKLTDWISVKDRLPEKSGDYIVYTKDGLVWPYFFQGDTWYDQLGYRTETVTHRRSMPEPPEEVSGNG